MNARAVAMLDAGEARQRYRRKNLLEHLVGPLGSVMLHVLIVLAAIKLMVFSRAEAPASIEFTVAPPVTIDLEPFERDLKELDEPRDIPDAAPPVDMNVPLDEPTALDQETPGPSAEDAGVARSVLDVENIPGPLVLKDLYRQRAGPGRDHALKDHGGDPRTESAVLKALEWLSKNQAPNGSWGRANQVGITGLGLLTFLAHGETTASAKYGDAVEKAIRFLVSQQDAQGGVGQPFSQPGVYSHAIATYALSEAYGLTRIPSLKPAVDKAVEVILRGQQAGGGWDYAYAKGERVDTSVAGWQIQALKAAYIAGSETPGIREALDRAAAQLKCMQDPETGQIGYGRRGAGNPPITAVGVLCLQLTGHAGDWEVEKGLQFMRGWNLRWDKPGFAAPLYGWYYITQAKFHQGGGDWKSWNQDLKRELPARQQDDGHWDFAGEEHGSNAGPAYATTLAALTLQVYYRVLPTYQPVAIEAKIPAKPDDITVEII